MLISKLKRGMARWSVLIEISDLSDPRLTDYTSLTDVALRRKLETERGLYMAESSKVIKRALDAGHTAPILPHGPAVAGRAWSRGSSQLAVQRGWRGDADLRGR